MVRSETRVIYYGSGNLCLYPVPVPFDAPHNAKDVPAIRQLAQVHTVAHPKLAQTMHKSQVPIVIIYMCRAEQRLQTPAYLTSHTHSGSPL